MQNVTQFLNITGMSERKGNRHNSVVLQGGQELDLYNQGLHINPKEESIYGGARGMEPRQGQSKGRYSLRMCPMSTNKCALPERYPVTD